MTVNPDLSGYRLIETMIGRFGRQNCAVVSSFGADSAVLLHLVAEVDAQIPVLFIDTGMHFPETLEYRNHLVPWLGLKNLRNVTADEISILNHDPYSTLHRIDPDACCSLRKVQPLSHALQGFTCWFNGRKHFQGDNRNTLGNVDVESSGRLRVNPLFNWTQTAVEMYRTINKLPRHPLEIHGYQSIGCSTCTLPGCNNRRNGRWSGTEKTECGIFFDSSGAVVRTNQPGVAE